MRKLCIYKPNKEMNNGAAIQFGIGSRKTGNGVVVFVEAAKQNKPKPAPGSSEAVFDWGDKLSMMLGQVELGDVVAYLDGFNAGATSVKFTHKSQRNGVEVVAGFELTPPKPDSQYANWGVRLSNNGKAVGCFITPGELILVRELFKLAITEHFSGFDRLPE